MVLTANQNNLFFDEGGQLVLTPRIGTELIEEEISAIDDLANFDKDSLKQVVKNLPRPAGRITDPYHHIAAGVTISTIPFILGEKA